MSESARQELIVVSNRLPVVIEEAEGGRRLVPGAGGLITAMHPVMKEYGGAWIGWAGGDEESSAFEGMTEDFSRTHGYRLKAVSLNAEEIQRYYLGASNETIWPLFHDLLGRARFDAENWRAYGEVNCRFARAVAAAASPRSLVWIHDYHLMLVAERLRRSGFAGRLAFFLHIPFPSPDLLRRLPWKRALILALLQYDLLGFQTARDQRNFVECAREFFPQVEVDLRKRLATLQIEGRVVRAGRFPISIDFDEFDHGARSPEAAAETEAFRAGFQGQKVVIGVDRLDYTKGVAERLLAFERALLKHPELQGRLSLIQFLIPSRVEVADYSSLKCQLDELVGRINGNLSRLGWTPVHYRYRTLTRSQLIGRYRAADIALITPLRDGMNLVAKEYCASHVDGAGALILSEFAGAADQLRHGALIVNPFDLEETADSIHAAFHMPPSELRRRMALLRSGIRRNDVHRWARMFLDAFTRDESAEDGEAAEPLGRAEPARA